MAVITPLPVNTLLLYFSQRTITQADLDLHGAELYDHRDLDKLVKRIGWNEPPAGMKHGAWLPGQNNNGCAIFTGDFKPFTEEILRTRLSPSSQVAEHDIILLRGHDWVKEPCPKQVAFVESYIKGVVFQRETGIPTIVCNGTSGWSSARYWNRCLWKGHNVEAFILFDSLNRHDSQKCANQKTTENAFAEMLSVEFGCKVRIVRLPDPPLTKADSFWGVDDYVAFHKQESNLQRMVDKAKPYEPLQATDTNPFDITTSALDYFAEPLPQPPEFIIADILPLDVCVLSGASGSSKTTLELNQGHHVILGLDWHGHKILRPGPVIYLTAEDKRETFRWRAFNLTDSMGLALEQHQLLRKQFHLFDCRKIRPRQFVTLDDTGRFQRGRIVDWVCETFYRTQPSVIYVDPWRFFAPPERTVNEGIAEAMTEMQRLQEEMNAAVTIVGHVNKSDVINSAIHQNATSGGAALGDHARSELQLVRIAKHSQGKMPRSLSKEKFAPSSPSRIFALYIHKLNHAQYDTRPIYIERNGWRWIDHPYDGVALTLEEALAQEEGAVELPRIKLYEFLTSALQKGKRYSKNECIESPTIRDFVGVTKVEMKTVADVLVEEGYAEERVDPAAVGRAGAKKKYLHPTEPKF